MTAKPESRRQEDILNYWFGQLKENEGPSNVYYKKWFAKDERVDHFIKTSFESDLQRAIDGHLRSWEEVPRGALALIILLDQFSRNIYRGSPRAFTQDPLALELCLKGIEKGFDTKLHPVERLFFYMPLEHSEDLEMQKKSVELFSMMEELFPSPHNLSYMVSEFKKYADMHYVIIERFGRFPHRNQVLGRKSTPEEVEFLKLPGSSF